MEFNNWAWTFFDTKINLTRDGWKDSQFKLWAKMRIKALVAKVFIDLSFVGHLCFPRNGTRVSWRIVQAESWARRSSLLCIQRSSQGWRIFLYPKNVFLHSQGSQKSTHVFILALYFLGNLSKKVIPMYLWPYILMIINCDQHIIMYLWSKVLIITYHHHQRQCGQLQSKHLQNIWHQQ